MDGYFFDLLAARHAISVVAGVILGKPSNKENNDDSSAAAVAFARLFFYVDLKLKSRV